MFKKTYKLWMANEINATNINRFVITFDDEYDQIVNIQLDGFSKKKGMKCDSPDSWPPTKVKVTIIIDKDE